MLDIGKNSGVKSLSTRKKLTYVYRAAYVCLKMLKQRKHYLPYTYICQAMPKKVLLSVVRNTKDNLFAPPSYFFFKARKPNVKEHCFRLPPDIVLNLIRTIALCKSRKKTLTPLFSQPLHRGLGIEDKKK